MSLSPLNYNLLKPNYQQYTPTVSLGGGATAPMVNLGGVGTQVGDIATFSTQMNPTLAQMSTTSTTNPMMMMQQLPLGNYAPGMNMGYNFPATNYASGMSFMPSYTAPASLNPMFGSLTAPQTTSSTPSSESLFGSLLRNKEGSTTTSTKQAKNSYKDGNAILKDATKTGNIEIGGVGAGIAGFAMFELAGPASHLRSTHVGFNAAKEIMTDPKIVTNFSKSNTRKELLKESITINKESRQKRKAAEELFTAIRKAQANNSGKRWGLRHRQLTGQDAKLEFDALMEYAKKAAKNGDIQEMKQATNFLNNGVNQNGRLCKAANKTNTPFQKAGIQWKGVGIRRINDIETAAANNIAKAEANPPGLGKKLLGKCGGFAAGVGLMAVISYATDIWLGKKDQKSVELARTLYPQKQGESTEEFETRIKGYGKKQRRQTLVKGAVNGAAFEVGRRGGSVIGGWIGRVVGGVIGSLIPGAGTAAGAAIGGIVGKFIGGFVGGAIACHVADKAVNKAQKGGVYTQLETVKQDQEITEFANTMNVTKEELERQTEEYNKGQKKKNRLTVHQYCMNKLNEMQQQQQSDASLQADAAREARMTQGRADR